jgi:hypothetical protein
MRWAEGELEKGNPHRKTEPFIEGERDRRERPTETDRDRQKQTETESSRQQRHIERGRAHAVRSKSKPNARAARTTLSHSTHTNHSRSQPAISHHQHFSVLKGTPCFVLDDTLTGRRTSILQLLTKVAQFGVALADLVLDLCLTHVQPLGSIVQGGRRHCRLGRCWSSKNSSHCSVEFRVSLLVYRKVGSRRKVDDGKEK